MGVDLGKGVDPAPADGAEFPVSVTLLTGVPESSQSCTNPMYQRSTMSRQIGLEFKAPTIQGFLRVSLCVATRLDEAVETMYVIIDDGAVAIIWLFPLGVNSIRGK